MNLIGRYIFRSAAGGFLGTLCILTGVVWVTQALKEIDLLTAQGQTLWLFFYLTALALPALILVIAPVALFIACVYTLNKLNADSELVVINAAGARQWQVARPFILLGVLVTLLCATISLVVMPESARSMRNLLTQIRADVLTHIVVEGRFTRVEDDLTFHIRERRPDGTLMGLLVHDARDPAKVLTYLAEQGQIVRDDQHAFLVMDSGSLHQRGAEREEMSIVSFDRYVFDLSSLEGRSGSVHYHPREMRLSELANPDPDNAYFKRSPGRFRSELHERISSIFYPLAFVLIALATLGQPRTNRQGRGNSMILAIAVVAGLRTIGFGATNLATSQAWAVVPMYATPLIGVIGGAWVVFGMRRRAPRLAQRLETMGLNIEALWPRGGLARIQAALTPARRR